MTRGFVPGDDVSLRTTETASELSDCPLPVGTRQPLTNGHQPAVEVVMKTVNHLTFIWPHVVPPGYHFFTLSFVDAPVLLANDINRRVVSHL